MRNRRERSCLGVGGGRPKDAEIVLETLAERSNTAAQFARRHGLPLPQLSELIFVMRGALQEPLAHALELRGSCLGVLVQCAQQISERSHVCLRFNSLRVPTQRELRARAW